MKGYERENEEYRIQRVHEVCFKDLTGEKFNRLTVLGVDHKRGKSYYWKCRCDCGNEVVVFGGALTSGHTKSCGCAHKKALLKDLTGKTFNRLTVIEYSHQEGKRHYWKCKCSCGNEVIMDGKYLRNGTIKSCGCLKIERCKSKKPKIDLVGKVFGDLIVESYVKHSYWKCRCKCGNEVVEHSYFLNNGSSTKCKMCSGNGISKIEKELVSIIRGMTDEIVIENDRSVLSGLEIDIYIPSLKLGIEYNGSAYHATENSVYGDKPKTYHRDKFLLAKESGVHLISIFDVDYKYKKDKIVKYLCDVLCGNIKHNIPNSDVIYTNNDYDDGEWLKHYGYVYDGQEDIPYFVYLNRFKVYRSGISRWKKVNSYVY